MPYENDRLQWRRMANTTLIGPPPREATSRQVKQLVRRSWVRLDILTARRSGWLPCSAAMKTPVLALLTVAICTIVNPVFAGGAPTTHQLVLTETSSFTLSGTYDGSAAGVSIISISTDHWGVTVGSATFSAAPQWSEPEDPAAFNVITLLAIPGQFIVNSDFLSNGSTPLMDGAAFTNFGTDSRDGGAISVTFNDRGDAATVPDTGSTAALLGLSITGLLGAARLKLRSGNKLAPLAGA